MKVFHCQHCQQLVFFENSLCERCKHLLAFLPDRQVLGSLEEVEPGLWESPLTAHKGVRYRLCQNYAQANVCNWAVVEKDEHPLCVSCRLTRVIPDLTVQGNQQAWYKLEVAKRRLLYGLLRLSCPVANQLDDPERGLCFEFLADPNEEDAPPVMTGHADGVITVSLSEADDVERERRRVQLREPYRTVLGHFRHEVGHYYWDRLIAESPRLNEFRELFGNEQKDYAAALHQNYEQGPPPDWQNNFVSAYASCHPWEDWAETWAHYMHIIDTVETAAACGVSLRPRRSDEPSLQPIKTPVTPQAISFETVVEDWLPLTYLLNNLNRGLGLPDGYPFVLSPPAIKKLRFVHQTIADLAP